jgi:hypothetical protein
MCQVAFEMLGYSREQKRHPNGGDTCVLESDPPPILQESFSIRLPCPVVTEQARI